MSFSKVGYRVLDSTFLECPRVTSNHDSSLKLAKMNDLFRREESKLDPSYPSNCS